MLTRTFTLYRNAFSGLSRDIWLLSLVTLINRSGTMVIPFLTVYLTQELQFTLIQAGYIMSIFGLGSILGSYLGGLLTDRYSYYPVMFGALFFSGMLFCGLQYMHSFWTMAAMIFVLSTVAEAFRPAALASIAIYSRPENLTRSFTLVRLAINLGFSVGPAIGGFLAATYGYYWLFWVDGFTCMGAALLFRLTLKPKKEAGEPATSEELVPEQKKPSVSAYRDGLYLIFLMMGTLTTIAFMQFFFTLPVYFKEVVLLNEDVIGLLLAGNGLLIALTEMALVYSLEGRFRMIYLISLGALMVSISFLVHLILPAVIFTGILCVFAITVGEMLNFPFSNSFAVSRSKPHNRGQYMALYSMSFSVTNIIAPTLGFQLAGHFGYPTLWAVMALFPLLAAIGYYSLRKWI